MARHGAPAHAAGPPKGTVYGVKHAAEDMGH